MPSLNSQDLGRVLEAEYDYKYKDNNGQLITIEVGEEFILIKKSNEDWWQVIKQDQKKPFYIPAAYMKECSRLAFPDHAYFKKAYASLQKAKKKQRLSDKNKPQVGKESSVELGSQENLTDEHKLSQLHASCDSLDRFIENENPYDEVPAESTILRPSQKRSSQNSEDDPEYANLDTIQTAMGMPHQSNQPSSHHRESKSPSTKPKSSHNLDVSATETAKLNSGKSIYRNLAHQDEVQPRIPIEQPLQSVTTKETIEDGWEVHLDNQTNSIFYLNPITGEMRVDPPRKSPRSPKTLLKKDSLNRVVPPAIPDVSKKPVLERSNLSPQFIDDPPSPLERRKTSPAKMCSSSPSSPLSYEETQTTSYFTHKDSNFSQDFENCQPEMINQSNNDNAKSYSPEVVRREQEEESSNENVEPVSQHTFVPITSSFSSPFDTTFDALHGIPSGWNEEISREGEVIFVNESSGERWHEMLDEQSGKYYYFNEQTNETSWQLPQLEQRDDDDQTQLGHNSQKAEGSQDSDDVLLEKSSSPDNLTLRKANTLERDTVGRSKLRADFGSQSSSLPHNTSPPPVSVKPRKKGFPRQVNRVMQARSMIILSDLSVTAEEKQQQVKSHSSHDEEIATMPLPHPSIERQGRLHWTKLMEAGKKQKKNWMQQWVVLRGNNLLFYKDQKQAAMSKVFPHGKPDSSFELRGATIDWAKDKSSKKNVVELQTVRGLSLLLQHDDHSTIEKWLTAIKETIIKVNQDDPIDVDVFPQKQSFIDNEEDEVDSKKKKDKKKKSKPARHASDAKNSDKVRSKLRKFINRRPTIESLQERGIIKETVFGCSLDHLCSREQTTVPNFVRMCVEEVEYRGLDIDGIYRVSGNLSHVQKLRYLVDRDEPVNLGDPQWADIHLITGSLKMFLRELPEPVFPFQFFDKFITACKIHDEHQRITAMKHLVQALPRVNGDTLRYLMKHFCNVVDHSAQNRMQVQNIAIVFGPTLLLKPPDESTTEQAGGSGHMAVYMVYQNQIIDLMLTEYDTIFG